ncbi:MAG: magnesium transporter [Paludibacter sp.]
MMDYRKINSHIILLLLVMIVSLAIAMIGRRVVLENGFDEGTANLTLVIILGVCVIAYLVILATLAHVIIPWIMQKLPNRTKIEHKAIDNATITNEKENTLELANQSRQTFEERQIEELNEKIKIFLTYSHLSIALLITDEDLLQLDKYIECYARKIDLPENITLIKTKRVNNNDVMRFGWNMANYFDYEKQEVVSWLQTIFSEMQKLDASYIKGKLKHRTKNQIIPIIEDIPQYLEEQKK